jgi:hypothetical protein
MSVTFTRSIEIRSKKSLTATDLLNLDPKTEDAFWDEYAAWRQADISEVAEKLKELQAAGIEHVN